MKEEKVVIKSLYTLRFIMFVFIFVHHSKWLVKVDWLAQSGLAVAGFIVLSGFLTGYLYNKKYDNISFRNILSFTYKRIMKLYPLHVIMLLISVGLNAPFNNSLAGSTNFIGRLLINLLLVQSWINNKVYYFSFNGVSWFLSTYLFLTLITVPILWFVGKINSKKRANLWLILSLIMSYVILIVITCFVNINNLSIEFWLYIFPPARMFEYMAGIFCGALIRRLKFDFKYDTIVFTFLELFSLLLVVIFIKYVPNGNYLSGWGSKWVIPTLIVFSIFTYQKGYISKLFSLNICVKLGSSTLVMYLIHQVVITIMTKINGVPVHHRYFALYMFLLTVVLGVVITNLQNYKKRIT